MTENETGGDHSPLPTVRDVLALPELRAGEPELIAGAAGRDRRVRWAHVAAGLGVAALLDGGELILTTGAGWPAQPGALRTLAESLIDAGVAAIVLELGHDFATAPEALRAACERHGVPLIALHREVRFVQITQRVHQRILAAQNEALEARTAVHAMLTELGLNRSPVDYVVEQLSATLDATVVLEDSAHRVVSWSGRDRDPARALEPWSRADGQDPRPEAGWDRVPVEARGTRWGHLTALPGAPHPAGRRTVLELGAFALALARLADDDGSEWIRFSAKRIFDTLLGGRYRSDSELTVQLAAAGLPVEGRVLLGATLRGVSDFGGHASLERALLETALRRAVAPEGRVLLTDGAGSDRRSGSAPDPEDGTLLALISLPDGSADRDASPLAGRLARELDMLLPSTVPAGWYAHLALGSPAHGLRQIIASLEQVLAAGRLPAASRTGRVAVQQAERQRLAYLVRGLAGSPELQEFTSETLGPLIAYDREHRGDLLRVLAAYLAHPANRSLAAQRSLLSRSVFYQRLALIEELLGADLSDGETIATLAVAMLAHRPGI